MDSLASSAQAPDDGARRKPRLAASLQINPGPKPWRPSASLNRNTWERPSTPSVDEDLEGSEQALVSVVVDGGPGEGAGVGEVGTARAAEDVEGQMGKAPRGSGPPAGPAGDFQGASRRMSLPLKDPAPSQAVSLLAQYAAGLGISLVFREDHRAGESGVLRCPPRTHGCGGEVWWDSPRCRPEEPRAGWGCRSGSSTGHTCSCG